MATTRLLTDAEVEAIPAVKAVFDDIRATRKSDFVNNFWRGLANDRGALKRIWEQLKVGMVAASAIDPLTKERSTSPSRLPMAPIASTRIPPRRAPRA
jgi:alkylhydroperoxidase family enzyme